MPHLGPTQDSIAVDVKPAGGRGMSWWSLFAPAQPPKKITIHLTWPIFYHSL